MNSAIKEALAPQVEHSRFMVPLTTKPEKITGLVRDMNAMGLYPQVLLAEKDLLHRYEEPRRSSAGEVTRSKAAFGKVHHKENFADQEIPVEQIIYAGMDTVHLVGQEAVHKLEDDKEETIEKARHELRKLLSWQDRDAQRTFGWSLALTCWNGSEITLEQFVYLKARSIDPDVIDSAIEEAVQSGLITKANTRIGLIELLINLDAVTDISISPRQDRQVWSAAEARDPQVLEGLHRAVIETSPLPLRGIRNRQ